LWGGTLWCSLSSLFSKSILLFGPVHLAISETWQTTSTQPSVGYWRTLLEAVYLTGSHGKLLFHAVRGSLGLCSVMKPAKVRWEKHEEV